MKQTAYELLALLDRNLRESVTLLKRLTACPGQRSDVLVPLSNEVQYVRAQIGFEVTSEANDFRTGEPNALESNPSQVPAMAQRPGRCVFGGRGP